MRPCDKCGCQLVAPKHYALDLEVATGIFVKYHQVVCKTCFKQRPRIEPMKWRKPVTVN